MWERWFAYGSYYSHGLLVPVISLFLIWQKRHELRSIKLEPATAGLWLFVAGIVLHLVSLLFRVYFTSGFSMLIVIAGIVWCVWGKNYMKAILFPIVFLAFMVPLPIVVVISISFQLKILAAQIATALLNVINIPAFQEGSYIRMTHAAIIVEDVCSGLRSLIALLALGALFSYWMPSGKIKRLVMFLSSVPIALVTNVCRIMALAIIGEMWGTRYITGSVESFFGFCVFVLAFFLLSEVEKLLK